MMKQNETKKLGNKGFSLIELIIVIAIMGILVALIAPRITGYVATSRTNTDNSNAKTIESAMERVLTRIETGENIPVAAAYTGANFNVNTALVNDAAVANDFGEVVLAELKGSVPATRQANHHFQAVLTGDATNGYTVNVTVVHD